MNARNYNEDATLKALDKELAQQKLEKYKDVGSDAEEIMSASEEESDNSRKSEDGLTGLQHSDCSADLVFVHHALFCH